jgi:prepilin-type N-terminal cleavage/methylation domain-containing protein
MSKCGGFREVERQAGFSLLEILIAIAMLGVLVGFGAMQIRARSATAYARDLKGLVQQGRFEAIKRNRPIAVIWSESAGEFRTVLGSEDQPCDPEEVLATASPANYRRLNVDSSFSDGDGIVWLPSGQARACDLGVFSEHIAVLNDGNTSRTVTVSLTGRVTIE